MGSGVLVHKINVKHILGINSIVPNLYPLKADAGIQAIIK